MIVSILDAASIRWLRNRVAPRPSLIALNSQCPHNSRGLVRSLHPLDWLPSWGGSSSLVPPWRRAIIPVLYWALHPTSTPPTHKQIHIYKYIFSHLSIHLSVSLWNPTIETIKKDLSFRNGTIYYVMKYRCILKHSYYL